MINKTKHFLYRMYGRIIKNDNIEKAEAEIIRFESLTDSAKQNVRTEKLVNILNRAYEEVPYYRKLFDQKNLYFPDAQSLVEFQKIPLLTRKIIRENFQELKNTHIKKFKYFLSNTSGSTGDPLTFILDKEYDDIKKGLRNFQIRINNTKPDETIVKLWGFYQSEENLLGVIKHWISNWLQNRVDLNSIYLTESLMAEFIETIKHKKSVFIEAYAQTAFQLAKFINKNAIEINNVSAITTSVSTLFNFMRDEIEKAFNCRVYNRYGTREASVIAFERENEDGLRISTSQYIVEVINENGQHCNPGEEGDVIITNFSNFAFPFIRYSIGDRAIVKELENNPIKSCLSFEKVTGRISSTFINEDGSFVDSQYFAHVIAQSINSGWIEKMQIIQLDYKHVQMNIVKIHNSQIPGKEIILMRKAIQKVMGEYCRVDFNFVDDIETSRNGKFEYVKSLINRKE